MYSRVCLNNTIYTTYLILVFRFTPKAECSDESNQNCERNRYLISASYQEYIICYNHYGILYTLDLMLWSLQ